MNTRKQKKEESRKLIVDAAAQRFRREGLAGATIADILSDAGLTHGTFYAHFDSKEALQAEAFRSAADETSDRWTQNIADLPLDGAVRLLLGRGLGNYHLKHPETGCPFAAAGSEVARGSADIRKAYEESLLAVAAKVSSALGDGTDVDTALAIHAMCLGGITMARSVSSDEAALRILRACRQFVLERHAIHSEKGAAEH
jgi:TetR/AcrR family transcriptional repressor of nem operon